MLICQNIISPSGQKNQLLQVWAFHDWYICMNFDTLAVIKWSALHRYCSSTDSLLKASLWAVGALSPDVFLLQGCVASDWMTKWSEFTYIYLQVSAKVPLSKPLYSNHLLKLECYTFVLWLLVPRSWSRMFCARPLWVGVTAAVIKVFTFLVLWA